MTTAYKRAKSFYLMITDIKVITRNVLLTAFKQLYSYLFQIDMAWCPHFPGDPKNFYDTAWRCMIMCLILRHSATNFDARTVILITILMHHCLLILIT